MLFDSAVENLALIEEIFKLMNEKDATVATAESCTGGILATLFTHLSGSSRFYLGGVSSYSNDSKMNILGVSAETIKSCGAVSRETAAAMAEGAQEKFGSDYSIAITGIAGPEGGTEEKPVGTVWCGYTTPMDTFTQKYKIDGDRSQVRSKVVSLVLKDLKNYIIKGL
jgi:PncC family amidohydrolase